MDMKFAGAIVLVLVTTSVFATAIANKSYQAGGSCPPCPCNGGSWGASPPGINVTHEPKTVVVGGSENWHWGYDYATWAMNYSVSNPFFIGDTLVFKYTTEHIHTVYSLPDYQSYQTCNITNGKQIGWPGDGVNEGVKFKLTANKPNEGALFYFACGEGNGYHCNAGKMKFSVFAWPRR